MSVTMRDIAQKLNVSRTTVSCVLNNRGNPIISEETKQRIIKAAQEMGYRPNHVARALKTGRTRLVALWVSSLTGGYFSDIIFAVHKYLRQSGYEMMLTDTVRDDNWRRNISRIAEWPIDGVIALDSSHYVDAVKQLYPGYMIPIVSMGMNPVSGDDSVGLDLRTGSEEAVNHLMDIGCKRIAFLCDRYIEELGNNEARYDAYARVLDKHGRKPEFIVSDYATKRSASDAIINYVEANGCPDGLFCYNDEIAVGAYLGLSGMGIRMPEDTAIVGFDGIDDTECTRPTLSTVRIPVDTMCDTACQYLLNRIENPNSPKQETILTPRLVVRESSNFCFPG